MAGCPHAGCALCVWAAPGTKNLGAPGGLAPGLANGAKVAGRGMEAALLVLPLHRSGNQSVNEVQAHMNAWRLQNKLEQTPVMIESPSRWSTLSRERSLCSSCSGSPGHGVHVASTHVPRLSEPHS